ncbi:GLPGLI family protein [Mucilaginibacter sp. PAMB04274]|uniref:GLPGLI family protein n=1 Tax=Mucilaginibacter sp. PAMB04274 TaxID=3138568 RepID=UPI0031F710A3
MTPKPYLTIFLFLLAVIVKAQKTDTAQAIVHYKFTHVRDTTNRDKPLVENMMLLVGNQASAYKSYDRKMRSEQMRKNIAEQVALGTGQMKINSTAGGLGPDVEYYQYPNEKKLLVKERLVNNYVVEEKLPVLNWKISPDTATIGGLQCQKATTHFKGRDYTAWFCADLPYRTGPWKLQGLPGLIVEATDAKKEVIFKFDGFEKVDKSASQAVTTAAPTGPGGRTIMFGGIDDASQNENVIALPANAIKATAKELNDLKEIRKKDPQAFFQMQMASMQSQMGGRAGGNVSFNTGGNVSVSPYFSFKTTSGGGAPVVENNPIELPEK